MPNEANKWGCKRQKKIFLSVDIYSNQVFFSAIELYLNYNQMISWPRLFNPKDS